MKLYTLAFTALCLSSASTTAQTGAGAKHDLKKVSAKPSMVYEGNTPRATAKAAAYQAVTPEQLAAADQVLVGKIDCELGQKVSLEALSDKPGYFRLAFKGNYYTVLPEPTTTGAVRLEDKRAGIVWLQIPAKSMMMNTRLGQRMVDDCKHPTQVAAR